MRAISFRENFSIDLFTDEPEISLHPEIRNCKSKMRPMIELRIHLRCWNKRIKAWKIEKYRCHQEHTRKALPHLFDGWTSRRKQGANVWSQQNKYPYKANVRTKARTLHKGAKLKDQAMLNYRALWEWKQQCRIRLAAKSIELCVLWKMVEK